MSKQHFHIAITIVLLLFSSKVTLCQSLAWSATLSAKAIVSVAASPAGKFVAALADDNTIALYDAATGTEMWRYRDTINNSKISAITLSDSSLYWVRVNRQSISYPASTDTIVACLYWVNVIDTVKSINVIDTSLVTGKPLGFGEINGSISVLGYQLTAFTKPLKISWGLNLYMTYQAAGGCVTIYQQYGQHKLYTVDSAVSRVLSNRFPVFRVFDPPTPKYVNLA